MRVMVGLTLGILGISGLAACSESDEAFRARYRTQAIEACVQGGRSSNPAGIDASRFCPCMVDGYMRATPSDRLKAERNETAPPAAARAAIEQCARQLLGGQAAGQQQNAAADALNGDDAAAESGDSEQ